MVQLLIIGGSDAGISAALRAREIDPRVSVTIVIADAFPNYSICGLPFYISGEIPDWHLLAHRRAEEIEHAGVELLLNHTARAIYPTEKTVQVIDTAGRERTLAYNRLLIATGARPVPPDLPGFDLPGVYLLHTMEDSFRVHQRVTEENAQSAIIIGAGYIGLEMADALQHRGMQVTLLVRSQVLRSTIDASLARLVEEELRRHQVEVIRPVAVQSIQTDGSRLMVTGSNGLRRTANLVLMAAGVRPNSALATSAGVPTGARGAIRVNREMATNLPDIYAA